MIRIEEMQVLGPSDRAAPVLLGAARSSNPSLRDLGGAARAVGRERGK